MNLRRRRREEPDLIDIAPLIDVVFILLIFFMVSTTFSKYAEIEVNLPQADAEQSEQKPESLELSIDAQGRYYLNGKALVDDKVETIQRALQRENQNSQDPVLIISADGKAPHQAVVTAMDGARQAGIVRISFATQHSQEQAPP